MFYFLLSAIEKFTANAIFFSGPGRPRRSWTRTVEKDLSALSIGLHMAWRRAQDREQWQRIVEAAMLQRGACPWWWWWCWWWWRPVFVRPAGRCSLTIMSRDAISLYLVEEFLWNLTKFSRLDVKGQGHSKVKKFLHLTRYLCTWILVKLSTNIQHVSENVWKGLQGQKPKVKVIARSNALNRLKDPIDLRLSVRCPPVNTYFAWRDISYLAEWSQTFIPYSQQATPPMYFWKFSRNL